MKTTYFSVGLAMTRGLPFHAGMAVWQDSFVFNLKNLGFYA